MKRLSVFLVTFLFAAFLSSGIQAKSVKQTTYEKTEITLKKISSDITRTGDLDKEKCKCDQGEKCTCPEGKCECATCKNGAKKSAKKSKKCCKKGKKKSCCKKKE